MPELTDSWWVIRGADLRQVLDRAHAGEDPGLLYTELWANSQHEDYRCTCPDVDITPLGEPPGSSTTKGRDPNCPTHRTEAP